MVWALIGMIALALVGWLYAIHYYHQQKEILPLNEAIEAQNEQYKQINEQRKQENEKLVKQRYEEEAKLSAIKETLKVQNNILKNVTETAEIEAQHAKERAQQEHDTAVAALRQEYDKIVQEYEVKKQRQAEMLANHLAINEGQIKAQEVKLQALKDLQDSYLRARKEAQELQEKKDYYRLAIATSDLEDIKSLRLIQKQFHRPEAIDKLIWELYVKPAYDILMPHIFKPGDKTCGIYMITNLTTEQAYIGQSVDCRERFRQHIKSGLSNASTSNKLYQAMKQYGVQDFIFQILEIVPRENLNEREAFWIDFYQTKNYGYNSTKGNEA